MVRLGSGSILDVGCGSGLLTCLVASSLPEARVSGWDRDEAAIDYARRLASAHGVSNAAFDVMDVETGEPETTPRFDAVTSMAVLQFVNDTHGVLRRFAESLVPGGHLVLQVPAADQPKTALGRTSWQACRLPDFQEARGGFSEDECRAMIAAVGLELVELTPIIKGPTLLAKEIFYLALSIHRSLAAAVCPILNWITVFDPGYRGAGAGYFIVARKPSS